MKCSVANLPCIIPGQNTYVLSRFDDVQWALRHAEVFSNRRPIEPSNAATQPLTPTKYPQIPMLTAEDPPVHSRHKAIVKQMLTPHRIAATEVRIREISTQLLDTFIDEGAIDFMETFARPLPLAVFADILGVERDELRPSWAGCGTWSRSNPALQHR